MSVERSCRSCLCRCRASTHSSERTVEHASLSGDGEPEFIGRAQVRLHDGICIAPSVGRRCAFWGRLYHAEAGVFAYMADTQWSSSAITT